MNPILRQIHAAAIAERDGNRAESNAIWKQVETDVKQKMKDANSTANQPPHDAPQEPVSATDVPAARRVPAA